MLNPDDKEMGDTMANYDRRILVPYLQDVCCAEMLCRKLEQDMDYSKAEADKYAGWASGDYQDPARPNRDDYKSNVDLDGGCAGVSGVLCLVSGFIMMIVDLGIIGGPCMAVGVMLMMVWGAAFNKAEEEASRRYMNDLNWYNNECAKRKEWRNSVSSWRMSLQYWREKENAARSCLQKAKELRTDLYGVNIIPSRYRNIHAAYYLYDYFDTGRETDLDKIIQTMLLDEIIQRMDKLIAQNQEIIINQRIQISQQEQQTRMIADNHREKMKRIAKMEQNQQLQLDYQDMIARNQKVTNFFLAADYFEKYK